MSVNLELLELVREALVNADAGRDALCDYALDYKLLSETEVQMLRSWDWPHYFQPFAVDYDAEGFPKREYIDYLCDLIEAIGLRRKQCKQSPVDELCDWARFMPATEDDCEVYTTLDTDLSLDWGSVFSFLYAG